MVKSKGRKRKYRLYKEWSAEDIIAALDEWEHLQGLPHDEVHGFMSVDHLRKTFLKHIKNQPQLSQGYELLHYGMRKLFGIDYETVQEWYRLSSASRHAKVKSIGAGSGKRHLAINNAVAKRNREQSKRYSSGGVTSNSAGVRPYQQKVHGWSLFEIDLLRKNYGNVPMDPPTWKLILPDKGLSEIHEQARRMGLLQTRKASEKPKKPTISKPKKSTISRPKPKVETTGSQPSANPKRRNGKPAVGMAEGRGWSDHEDDVIRAYYPKLGISGTRWPVWPKDRRPSEVRLRAVELDLVHDDGSRDNNNQVTSAPQLEDGSSGTRRGVWAADLVERFYEIYGSNWSQWKRIVPWMKRGDLEMLASSLGRSDVWDDSSKLSFIENEGIDWSLGELNVLIVHYPIRTNGSIDWELDLPFKPSREREDIAQLLGLPTKRELGELARKAKKL